MKPVYKAGYADYIEKLQDGKKIESIEDIMRYADYIEKPQEAAVSKAVKAEAMDNINERKSNG